MTSELACYDETTINKQIIHFLDTYSSLLNYNKILKQIQNLVDINPKIGDECLFEYFSFKLNIFTKTITSLKKKKYCSFAQNTKSKSEIDIKMHDKRFQVEKKKYIVLFKFLITFFDLISQISKINHYQYFVIMKGFYEYLYTNNLLVDSEYFHFKVCGFTTPIEFIGASLTHLMMEHSKYKQLTDVSRPIGETGGQLKLLDDLFSS